MEKVDVGEELVIRTEHADVVELRLNRPPVNVLSGELLADLRKGIEHAQRDSKAIVLSGKPGRFLAGFDIPVFLGLDRQVISTVWHELYSLLETSGAQEECTISNQTV